MFKIKKINEKNAYYSTKLKCEHFFTTRDLIVKDNLDIIASYLNIDKKDIIKPTQTHSDNIEIVEENKYDYPQCDSLILPLKNKAIYLNFADCTPVILYDNKNNIGAIAHCGWRGTAMKLAAKTVLKMEEIFNTNPQDMTALIGPCISFKYFETSLEAILELKKTVKDQNGLFNERYADLKGINERQLQEIGVQDIEICPYCTVFDNDKFFSYRKEQGTKKRHSALIFIE